tara:strand:- start:500 stop:637 length:138 start_codon:yes stop_codon:yes gene_type:complete
MIRFQPTGKHRGYTGDHGGKLITGLRILASIKQKRPIDEPIDPSL